MKETFAVFVWSEAKQTSYDIDELEFSRLKRAHDLLIFGLAFEQRLDIALENFAELERCLITFALRDAIFSGATFDVLHESRHVVNRHLTNLMASCRLYLDQTRHALSSTYGKTSKEAAEFTLFTNNEYDNSLAYRALEALRNYSQHCGLPAHGISFSSSHDNVNDPGSKMKHRVSVSLNAPALAEDGQFKAETLDELRRTADTKGHVALMPLVREYISGLGRIHDSARDLIAPTLSDADDVMRGHLGRAEKETGAQRVMVHASRQSDGMAVDDVRIGKALTEQRNEYRSRTQFAKYVSKQYVASC